MSEQDEDCLIDLHGETIIDLDQNCLKDGDNDFAPKDDNCLIDENSIYCLMDSDNVLIKDE